MNTEWTWARYSRDGYELSSAGDKRFSALVATLPDGRTIEEAYQLDVKGWRYLGNDWRIGKGKPPIGAARAKNMWEEYLALWFEWAVNNPELITDLRVRAYGKVLTDRFASTQISQARALAHILNLIGD